VPTHKKREEDFWGQFGVACGLVKVGVNDVLTSNLGLEIQFCLIVNADQFCNESFHHWQ